MQFPNDLGNGYTLRFYELDNAPEMLNLIVKNLDRLRKWEPWAQEEQTLEGTEAFIRSQLEKLPSGEVVPCIIFHGDKAVGSITLRINAYYATAELGYWIDSSCEGQGVVTRACTALIEYGRKAGVKRFEIRTSVGNERSAAVARRLNFSQEGVLSSAIPIGEQRHDVILFALLA